MLPHPKPQTVTYLPTFTAAVAWQTATAYHLQLYPQRTVDRFDRNNTMILD